MRYFVTRIYQSERSKRMSTLTTVHGSYGAALAMRQIVLMLPRTRQTIMGRIAR